MNEVTRYDLTEDVSTGEVDITPVPERMQGRYVTFEDYEALAQQLNATINSLNNAEEALKVAGIEADTVQAGVLELVDKLRIKQNHIKLRDTYIEELEHRAESAEVDNRNYSDLLSYHIDRQAKAERELAELGIGDYFAELVLKARLAADKAMLKFPQPNYVLLKVAEEAGEVVQAGVHYAENRMTWQELEGEVVQLLAMLIRLVTEGDQINGIIPPDQCRADMLRNIDEISEED